MALTSKPLDQVRPLPVDVIGKEEQVRINFIVPKSIRNAWKEAALKQEKTLTELIVESMSKYSNK